MKNIFIGGLIISLLIGVSPSLYGDLSRCEKSEINRVCIENKYPEKIKVLLDAVKKYQHCDNNERHNNHKIVKELLREILEVE